MVKVLAIAKEERKETRANTDRLGFSLISSLAANGYTTLAWSGCDLKNNLLLVYI